MKSNPISAPIPGMGLTSQMGSRPWQRPPQYATLDQVIPYYMSAIDSPKFVNMFLDSLEAGVPVTALVDTMVQASVMEGKHTIDVGILVSPIMVEAFIILADRSGIEYTSGLEEEGDGKMTKSAMRNMLKQVFDSPSITEDQLEAREEITQAAETAGKGLMSKRGSE